MRGERDEREQTALKVSILEQYLEVVVPEQ